MSPTTLPPDADPQQLIEEPFELEGYLYSFADITKEENLVEDSQPHRETVTVETAKKDLASVLEELPPTMEYDDGTYKGTLALDHATLHTEATGYAQGSRTITEVKTLGPLDRNDMSYVPATTVKDGRTLSLTGVDWQVIGTDLVGETLTPSSYQAVATYSGKASYSYATGYVSTAEYVGEVTRNEVKSVTYTVLYTGAAISPTEPENAGWLSGVVDVIKNHWPALLAGIGAIALAVLVVLYLHERRKNQDAEYVNAPLDADETEGHDREDYGDVDGATVVIGQYPAYEIVSLSGDGYACAAKYPEAYQPAAAHTQGFVDGLAGMTDQEKVKAIAC